MGTQGSGGRGGDAFVKGDNSTAEGGEGGDAVLGDGGDGGKAIVDADNSRARGGRGGRGGIGPGGPGGDAHVVRDQAAYERLLNEKEEDVVEPGGRGGHAFVVGENPGDSLAVGGDGGEACQADGRGGRGGRAFMPAELRELLGIPDRRHMRWPYFEPITEPGRGGDAADTPQYKARRLIIERLKRRYFRERDLESSEAWWDREVVPLHWLREQILRDGHRWAIAVVADEYEFTDLPLDAGRNSP